MTQSQFPTLLFPLHLQFGLPVLQFLLALRGLPFLNTFFILNLNRVCIFLPLSLLMIQHQICSLTFVLQICELELTLLFTNMRQIFFFLHACLINKYDKFLKRQIKHTCIHLMNISVQNLCVKLTHLIYADNINFVSFDHYKPGHSMIANQSSFEPQVSPSKLMIKISSEITQQLSFPEQVTCLECYQDKLYVGTSESKVIIYQIMLTEGHQKPINIKYGGEVYPHCNSVQFIQACRRFLIMIPKEEQQLIRIWNRDPLTIMHGFRGHQKQITQVIFLMDGVHIASSSHDATIRIWNIFQHGQSNKEKYKYQGKFPILALQEVDEHNIVFGGDGCYITLWNWLDNQVKCKTFGHPGSVVTLSHYKPYIVSSGGDSKIKIWQLSSIEQTKKSKEFELSDVEISVEITELHLKKEIKDRLRAKRYCFSISEEQMLLLDSQGDLFFIDYSLNLKMGHVSVDYWREIISAKIWKNYLLFFCSSEEEEVKHLHIYFISSLYVDEENKGQEKFGEGFNNDKKELPAPMERIAENEDECNNKLHNLFTEFQ